MTIYLDWDGTVVEHQYPKMGELNPGAVEVITRLHKARHIIIINTMRAEIQGEIPEIEAMLPKIGLEFLGNNPYRLSKLEPHPFNMKEILKSRILCIDDIAEGIPLRNAVYSNGKMVDWKKLDEILKEHKI